jgi:hypothetical protein
MPRARPVLALALPLLLASLVGCGDDGASSASSSSGGGQGGDGSTASSAGGSTMDGSPTGSGGQGGGDACPAGDPPALLGANSCGELGATDCFTNEDCAASERCENVGTADVIVPCCQPGARGEGPLGAPCSGENACASSLCIVGDGGSCGLCTGTCASAADCPAELPQCIPIAFSGSDATYCLP